MVPRTLGQVRQWDGVRQVFWNHSEDRLRSGWRVLLQAIVVTIPLLVLASLGVYSSSDNPVEVVVATALPLTLASLLILGRWVDKRSFSDFGLRLRQKRWWADYGVGILVGVIASAAFSLAAVVLGWAKIAPLHPFQQGWTQAAIPLLATSLPIVGVGIFEEANRVYQVRNLTEGLASSRLGMAGGMLVAVLVSGLYSVAMHTDRPGAGFLVFVLFSGILYGLFYLWTGRAALAMAAHFAWDCSTSILFLLGTSASTDETAFFLVSLDKVPEWGDGVLISVLGMAAKVLWLLLVGLWLRWRDGRVRLQDDLAVPTLLADSGSTT